MDFSRVKTQDVCVYLKKHTGMYVGSTLGTESALKVCGRQKVPARVLAQKTALDNFYCQKSERQTAITICLAPFVAETSKMLLLSEAST